MSHFLSLIYSAEQRQAKQTTMTFFAGMIIGVIFTVLIGTIYYLTQI